MSKQEEIWKELDFTDRKYELSNLGRVKSYANSSEGVIIRGKLSNNRLSVDLKIKGKRKSFFVHRLVAEIFVPKESEKHKYVKHINNDTFDNRAENLQWVTEEVTKAKFFEKAKSGGNKGPKPTVMPDDGKEYFKYAGFYFRVHDNGSGKFIRVTVAPNVTKSVTLAEIILERKGEPRPTPEHVILYKDADCYNVSPDNVRWVTRSEKSKILLKKNVNAYLRVQEMGKKNKKPFVVSDKMRDIIKNYRDKGRSYAQISKILGYKYSRLYKYCKESGL
ncbi:HNH endonuclease [Flexithrix dorotheae]|uniref:HNH endonuclease n=1 Tax=Flexithrix dorotheae TaxID=70993 RepID=UPI00037B52D8|nr:HNH endonuclease [Flexithrix dorotheae]